MGRRNQPHDPAALGHAGARPALQDDADRARTGETKTEEYTKLNPRQKVPLLQDGDFCIGESAAIGRLPVANVFDAGALPDPGTAA